MQLINPANGQVFREVDEDTTETISEKIHHLKRVQEEWAAVPVKERLGIISTFGKLVKAQRETLAQWLTQETGKPIQQARNEVTGAHNRIAHLQKHAEKWLAEELLEKEGSTQELIRYEPLGVIANISAWNFPYNIGYNVFLYALVAGNAVAYKPSEHALLTGFGFKSLLEEAGLPKGLFEVIVGKGEVGETLLKADIDGCFFTGSYATGKKIATQLAGRMIPLQLELGGKDPLYVMEDVRDIKQAAKNAAEGAFYNNGQSCCAVERIYVHASIYEEFLDQFLEEVRSYTLGDPLDETTFIGPLTRKDQPSFLFGQVKDALEKGATLHCGGKIPNRPGFYFEPAVLSEVNHEMELMREESFGPIIGIQRVEGDKEAAKLMADTNYGLTAAVFSQDKNRALQLLDRLNVGTVYWNCCDRVSPNLPWSGRKQSGVGSTLSYQGIRVFTQPKAYQLREG
ncbi:aldehyde dehydrogenase family protein [Pleomorphovibrio marinus]|uniref:aldehyde dehydrogenase family protein n=1 Tax=Pleomorphovibrio marinus TaxID=2164132 RepID=UPI000E0AFDCF|nr:aldehyde dehydrogenase family protein [Pleomorphovibrio marinus]